MSAAPDSGYESEKDEDYDPEKGAGKSSRRKDEKAKVDNGEGAAPAGAGGRGGVRTVSEAQKSDPLAALKADAKKAKINALWEQMNAANKTPPKPRPAAGVPSVKEAVPAKKAPAVPEWMVSLGLAKPPASKAEPLPAGTTTAPSAGEQSKEGDDEEAKAKAEALRAESRAAAAAALAAAKAAAEGKPLLEGKVEVTEVRDFAGEAIKVTRTVDAKGALAMKRKAEETAKSGLDALLQQIEKKKKINILDKSRKDWGEFKEETGIVEDLEKYKKSKDKYLDRVEFLQKAELKEYEVERDQKLAAARKKPTSFAGLDD